MAVSTHAFNIIFQNPCITYMYVNIILGLYLCVKCTLYNKHCGLCCVALMVETKCVSSSSLINFSRVFLNQVKSKIFESK